MIYKVLLKQIFTRNDISVGLCKCLSHISKLLERICSFFKLNEKNTQSGCCCSRWELIVRFWFQWRPTVFYIVIEWISELSSLRHWVTVSKALEALTADDNEISVKIWVKKWKVGGRGPGKQLVDDSDM